MAAFYKSIDTVLAYQGYSHLSGMLMMSLFSSGTCGWPQLCPTFKSIT
jgi:hypothetical protein